MPPRKRPSAAAATSTTTGRPPTPATAASSASTPPTSTPNTPNQTTPLRLLFILLVNAIAAAALYNRVSSGAIPFPEPVARLVADVTVGLGLGEALPGLAAASSSQNQKPCGLLDHTSFILASSRVVFPDGVRPGALLVRNGKIAATAASADALQPAFVRWAAKLRSSFLSPSLAPLLPSPLPVHDYGYSAISPGVVDVHAHLNEPGREEWEGVATGTAAAAAGGVTTLIDMPLNSAPAAVTAELVAEKAAAVRKAGPRVDVGLWGGLVPANAHSGDGKNEGGGGNGQPPSSELERMLAAGALGFKSFMCPSGIRDFEHVSVDDVRAALPQLMRLGVPYLVHAELVDAKAEDGSGGDAPAAKPPPPEGDRRRRRQYASYLATRPAEFEREAIGALITALDEAMEKVSGSSSASSTTPKPGFKLHVAHLGDGGASAAALAAAKRRFGSWLSVETCPHYLLFDSQSVRDGDTRFKCAPPLRSPENREALLRAVRGGGAGGGGGGATAGLIDLVSSDHSPAPAALKGLADSDGDGGGDFIAAWGGINGLQYLLPATWTALRGVSGGSGDNSAANPSTTTTLTDLARLLSSAPASLAGLARHKGALRPGMDADVVVWDPEAKADTSAERNRHRHGPGTSPYVGNEGLRGRVLATFVRGSLVFDAKLPVGQEVAEGEKGGGDGSGTCGRLISKGGGR